MVIGTKAAKGKVQAGTTGGAEESEESEAESGEELYYPEEIVDAKGNGKARRYL